MHEQIHRRHQQQQQSSSSSTNQLLIKTETNPTTSQQIQVRDELGKAFGNNNNLNNLLYPAALVNLPQEVLMNLVQSGHLQVEEEGKSVNLFFYFIFTLAINRICFNFI